MVSAVAQAYMGVWGLGPQWGPGTKPLVGGQGDEVPPKLAIFSNWKYIVLKECVAIFAKLEKNN